MRAHAIGSKLACTLWRPAVEALLRRSLCTRDAAVQVNRPRAG